MNAIALRSTTAPVEAVERVIRIRTYPDVLSLAPVDYVVRWGATIQEIVDSIPLEPGQESRRKHFDVYLGRHKIERKNWRLVRPAAYARHTPVMLQIRLPLHGGRGGGGGGSKALSALAAIALIGLSIFTMGGGFSFLGAAFASGELGAKILGAAISVGGSLLLQGLQQPPKQDKVDDVAFASAENNFEPGGYLPRVIGTHRVTPAMIVPPFTTINNGEKRDDNSYRYSQYVTAVYALAGTHRVGTIYVGGVDIETLGGVEYEVREGYSTDTHLTLVSDTRIEDPINIQLTEWEVDPDETTEGWIEIFGTEQEAEPQWHRMETGTDVDEFRIEFLMPNGLNYADPSDGENKPAAVAVRLRMRQRLPSGWDEWVNLPEMMIKAKEPNNGIRMHLVIQWVDDYPADAGSKWPALANTGKVGGDISIVRIKGISQIYTHADWSSNLLTVDGDGYAEWHYESDKRVFLYLKKSDYPQGRWQFEAKRSWAFRYNSWNFDNKTFSINEGDFNDLFRPHWNSLEDRTDEGRVWIRFNPSAITHSMSIPSVQSVWNEYPIGDDDEYPTLLAIRAKDRQLGTVEIDASGVLEKWDATVGQWDGDQTSSIPGDWYRHVLIEAMHNAEPVEESLLVLPMIQYWSEWCLAHNKTVNAVIQNRSVPEVLQIIAQAGWASPIFGSMFSVVIDRRRTDGPVGLITLRNANRFRFEKPFPELPHALRITFRDEDEEYKAREIIVYAPGYAAAAGVGVAEATRFETVTYEGITTEIQATARAELDLKWAVHRGTLHHFVMDIEHLEFARGDLVLMETDILGAVGGRGRIAAINTEGGLITSIDLDEDAQYGSASEDLWTITDLLAEDDLYDVGLENAGAVLRMRDGTLRYEELTDLDLQGNRIVFSTPFAMPTSGGDDLIEVGTLVAMGPLGTEAREVLIWDIQPGPDATAEIVAIDYAHAAVYGADVLGDGAGGVLGIGDGNVLGLTS